MKLNLKIQLAPQKEKVSGYYVNKCAESGVCFLYFDFENGLLRETKSKRRHISPIMECCSANFLNLISEDGEILASSDSELNLPEIPETFMRKYFAFGHEGGIVSASCDEEFCLRVDNKNKVCGLEII